MILDNIASNYLQKSIVSILISCQSDNNKHYSIRKAEYNKKILKDFFLIAIFNVTERPGLPQPKAER